MKGRAGIRIKKIYGGGNYGREFRKDCIWRLNPQNQETFRNQSIWCRGWGGIILEIHKEYDYFFRTSSLNIFKPGEGWLVRWTGINGAVLERGPKLE